MRDDCSDTTAINTCKKGKNNRAISLVDLAIAYDTDIVNLKGNACLEGFPVPQEEIQIFDLI